jgi:hypothetical protein
MRKVHPSRYGKFNFRRFSLGSWSSTNDMVEYIVLPITISWAVEPRLPVRLMIAEPKWPGEPCRPAGEKTPPTATLLIKTLLVHPS